MTITVLSRWKGSREDMVRVGEKMKPIAERLGAESMRVGQSYSGPYAGQWIIALRYTDWTSYGKAMDAAASDEEFQATYAEALEVGEFQGRGIIVGVIE